MTSTPPAGRTTHASTPKSAAPSAPSATPPRPISTNKTISNSRYRRLTSNLRLLPQFLIIGAQKSGTTTLFDYIAEHPCIGSPTAKELHFFDRLDRLDQGLSWYRAQFPTQWQALTHRLHHRHPLITGEATPSYLFNPMAPQRIAKALPNIKLIILLRNPIDRAFSHYQMSRRNGKETLSFTDAIEQEHHRVATVLERMQQDAQYFDSAYARYSYLSRGIYIKQLEHWHQFFPRKQFLVLKSEDFFANPQATLAQVFQFLELPLYLPQTVKVSYAGSYQDAISPQVRADLKHFFAPYNQNLYEFLGVDYAWET
jgi:Sulfotransferase domain